MTIAELIAKVDQLKPNSYPTSVKVGWLSTLDGRMVDELFKRRLGNPAGCGFKGYDESTDINTTELLAPWPWGEDMYTYYLQSCIDRENGETRRYNQTISLYNTAYKNFADWWNREHRPAKHHHWKL